MSDCLFCGMAGGEIPIDPVYEDEELMVIRDINPQAPVHWLIIPRVHITNVNDLESTERPIAQQMIQRAAKLAKAEGIAEDGYRLVFNCNQNGGQTVYHLHMHLLGGRNMRWPPG